MKNTLLAAIALAFAPLQTSHADCASGCDAGNVCIWPAKDCAGAPEQFEPPAENKYETLQANGFSGCNNSDAVHLYFCGTTNCAKADPTKVQWINPSKQCINDTMVDEKKQPLPIKAVLRTIGME
jgi:hypothetical protein